MKKTHGLVYFSFISVVFPAQLSAQPQTLAQSGHNALSEIFSQELADQAAPEARIEYFQNLYAPFFGKGNDLISKIIGNTGNGYEPLYGLRNMRVVLHGVMYRGGANNFFHKTNKRNNMNPLPQDGLDNLCKESFGSAIYLYEKNFVPQSVTCTSRTGNTNTLQYSQVSVLSSPINGNPKTGPSFDVDYTSKGNEVRDILEQVYDCTQGIGSCPIYTHCWNGWHASGLISAVALRQFCDFSADQAVQYWIDGTDSLNNSNYPTVKAAIREFKPLPELKIGRDIQEKICPKNPYKDGVPAELQLTSPESFMTH